MKVTQKPVTFEAIQFTGNNDKSIEDLLKDTRLQVVERGNWYGLRIQFPPPPYETHGYVENGKVKTVAPDSWVVVSSTGEVRILKPEEYEAEFYEHWEMPESVEQNVALLAKYLYRLANNDVFDVDPGDWSKLELLSRDAE
jgi:hypothetical protein